jgi:O-acetyl-ADP-ribose deacetylase (regulator of RNase III)
MRLFSWFRKEEPQVNAQAEMETFSVGSTRIIIKKGSVVRYVGDAIVNAANRRGLGGGAVDGAINRAGGDRLKEARRALPEVEPGIRIPRGEARVTLGTFGKIQTKGIIHAVGPSFPNDAPFKRSDALLRSAYRNTLFTAKENGFRTIGFCLISAGKFSGGRGLEDIIGMGLSEIRDTLAGEVDSGIDEITLHAFSGYEWQILKGMAKQTLGDPG